MLALLGLAALLQGDAATAYRLGVELFQQGRAREAVPKFEEAARQAPNQAEYWKALGVALASQGEYREAEPPLRKACELNPKEPDACYYFGRSLYALDRFEESLAALERAKPIENRPWRLHLGVALAKEALSLANEAEPAYRAAISQQPAGVHPDFDARLHYGVYLFRQGRVGEALAQLGAAAESHTKHARTAFEYGRALYHAGRLAEARTQLERAVTVDREHAAATALLEKVRRRLPSK